METMHDALHAERNTDTVLPHGYIAIDDVCVVRMNAVCAIRMSYDALDNACVHVHMDNGTVYTVQHCDMQEILRRMRVQKYGNHTQPAS